MRAGQRCGLRRLASALSVCLLSIVASCATPGPPAAAGSPACSVVARSAEAADAAVRSARGSSVVCMAPGTYPGLDLAGEHARYVKVQPMPGQAVTLVGGRRPDGAPGPAVYVEPGASHITVRGFNVTAGIQLEAGDSFITVDHNNITGSAFGVWLDSSDCTAPHAPTWAACAPRPKIRDVTISGSRFHDITDGSDAIDIANYARVRITGNEFVRIVDHPGGHTDCLQSTFGGSGLLFDHNYEHDNNCQGFFIKDGDVTDATVYDNLFVRDQVARVPEQNIDIVNVDTLVIRNNTSWPDTGDILRDLDSGHVLRADVSRNVLYSFANGCCNDQVHFALSETDNIFGTGPWTFVHAATDQVRRPTFVNPAADDFRLARNTGAIGIDWQPGSQRYGP